MSLASTILGSTFASPEVGKLIEGAELKQPSQAKRFKVSELNNPNLDIGFDINDAPGLDVPELIEGVKGKKEGEFRDLFGNKTADKNLAAKQYVGISAVSTGLQTAGALANIRAQEADAVKQIQDQFKFETHEIKTNARIRGMVRTRARTQNLISMMNRIKSQAVGGGRQTQQFFRNPMTGSSL